MFYLILLINSPVISYRFTQGGFYVLAFFHLFRPAVCLYLESVLTYSTSS